MDNFAYFSIKKHVMVFMIITLEEAILMKDHNVFLNMWVLIRIT